MVFPSKSVFIENQLIIYKRIDLILEFSIELPILPTVTARITFQSFQLDDNIPDSLFEIPSDFSEDPNRFPDL
jgi:hypothetical protein